MSLEAALAEHTAALKANTAMTEALLGATKDLLSLRTDAVEKVTAAVAASGKGKASEPKKDEAKKDEAKGADAGKGQISTDPENRTNPYEGIKDSIAEYLSEIDRPEERDARKVKVVALLNHEKIKRADLPADAKPDVANIKEDAIDLFKKNLAGLKAKGALTEPAAKKADDDLDL
ncbi:hypothetical protein NKI96_10585 [Mesorhizobium sp. M0292]|uniref:hypothetical protein n=1 Tax=Mesorhizobium sp. M0292 TaxID=2956929 RepID=UPI003338F08F